MHTTIHTYIHIQLILYTHIIYTHTYTIYLYSISDSSIRYSELTSIGSWGGESAAAPIGKSFRFVRACERARARSNRFRLPRCICRMIASFVFIVCPAVAPHLFGVEKTKHIRKTNPNCSVVQFVKSNVMFVVSTFCVFSMFAQGFSLKMKLV